MFNLKSVTALVAFMASITAIVVFLGSIDERYAKADEVNQTQTELIQSIKLVNINLELINLKNRKLELKGEKRSMMLQVHSFPNDVNFKLMLDDIVEDLDSVCQRINKLETSIITK